MVTVGEKIKEYRKSTKINQTKLAKKADISRTYLSDVENGRYKPSISLLRKISEALAGSGGVIKIGNITYENNKSSLDTVIYNSLMEAAGYINEDDFLNLQLNALQNQHMDISTQYKVFEHELRRSDLPEEDRKRFNFHKNKLEVELQNLSVAINSLEELKRNSHTLNKSLDMSKELNKNFNGWGNLEDTPLEEIKKSLEKSGYKVIENITPKIDLEAILTSHQEVTFKGKTLTDEEKQKALQILNITID